METKIETLEDSQIKATVTIDAADVNERIKSTYKEFAQKYNFPGFRKGKAPRPVIDNALGEDSVLSTVAEDLVNDTYPLVVEAERLYPVGSPTFDDVEAVEDNKPFTFTFTVSVKPVAELTSYEPLEIELPVEGATDAEIDEQIDTIRAHYNTYEDAGDDTALTTDNYADLTIEATDDDGNALESIESESRLYEPGSSMFSDAFDKEILGMKKGETKKFSLEVPEDEKSVVLSTQAGKTVNFTVTCNAVKNKTLPEVTDEWVKETLGFKDVADLRKQVSESIADQKAQIFPQLKESVCGTELIKRFEGEVPGSMAEEEETKLLQDFFTQLQQQGLNFDAYLTQQNITPEQFKEDVKHQALDECKQQLALDAWARHKGIEATDEEVSEEFVKAGLDDPAATEKEWRDSGRLYLIREGIVRAKAMKDVLDSAKVTEVDYAAKAREEESSDEPDKPDESDKSDKSDKDGDKNPIKESKAAKETKTTEKSDDGKTSE